MYAITDFTELNVVIAIPTRREAGSTPAPFMVQNQKGNDCAMATLYRTYVTYGKDMYGIADMWQVAMDVGIVQEDFSQVPVTVGWTGLNEFDQQVERMMLSVIDSSDIDKLIELIFTSTELQKNELIQRTK